MFGRDVAFLALRAITAHGLRSVLTLLGVAVGIAAVILLTSIGEGVHRYVLAEFSQFGTRVVAVAPGRTRTRGGAPVGLPTSVRPLTLDDARALEQIAHVTGVVPTAWGNAEVEGNGRLRRTTVYGVDSDALAVFNMRIASGRFLPDEQAEQARALVVLGAKLRRELFDERNPLGQRVRIGSIQFRVIGVLEAKGQFLGIDLDDTAFVPAARALELFDRDGLTEINLSYDAATSSAAVAAEVERMLTARHGRLDFTVRTQEEMLRALSNILDILTLAVAGLGGISLVVGGVGIVTIMTIAVSERTSEIGLMVALGGQRRTILALFLGEAVVLATIGGLAGLALGIGVAQLLHVAVPALPVHTPLQFALLAEGVAMAVGLLAGVLPARRAARLDPIEALRAE
ncbi:MAG: ABC transporter permease [Burkholderiales bacterium]|nr:MAG: ABC transporter permease [Burkholderiales bacterium]